MVGLNIEEQSGKIKVEIVPNRAANTISELFKRHYAPDLTIITDGHKSYPSAVSHIIVNHSIGFKNLMGFILIILKIYKIH